MPKNKNLDRKTKDQPDRRIVILDQEKCKPKSPAWSYLKRQCGACGKECISLQEKTIVILETVCPPDLVFRTLRCGTHCRPVPVASIVRSSAPTTLSK